MGRRIEVFTDRDLAIVAAHLRAAQDHLRQATDAVTRKVPAAKLDVFIKSFNGTGDIGKLKSIAENAYCQYQTYPPRDADHKLSWGILFSDGKLKHNPECEIDLGS